MTEEVKKESSTEVPTKEVSDEVKNARVIQLIQSATSGRIEIVPLQNIKFRSDIVGILIQALNNINNEDVMRNEASLLREVVDLIKTPPTVVNNTTVGEPVTTEPTKADSNPEA